MSGRGATLSRRTIVSIAATVVLATGCSPAPPTGSTAPGSPAAGSTVPGSPTEIATAAATRAADPPLRAAGLRLVGSLPGSNGDFAFWGDRAFVTRIPDWDRESAGDGFDIVDIADPTRPTVLGSFRCPGSFQDVSVWDDLAVLSQDRIRPTDACEPAPDATPMPNSFAGLRIVSIAEPAKPILLASVQTGLGEGEGGRLARGSHTNTIVPDLEHERLIVYAGQYYYPGAKPSATIVEIPLADPASARAIGTFDNGTNSTCHDITVFVPRHLAACAAYEAGVILFDIADPEHPSIVSHVIVPRVTQNGESHHSTSFSNDGRQLVINAETETELGSPCGGGTDSTIGSLWFYDVADLADPQLRGTFQLPRPTTGHFCYAHQSNVVPTTGDEDLVVTGWFGGGIDLVDFTDPAAPRELAYWVSGEGGGRHSFTDTAYWYGGRIYAANLVLAASDQPPTTRGFEIFEVDAGIVGEAVALPHLNPQTHEAAAR